MLPSAMSTRRWPSRLCLLPLLLLLAAGSPTVALSSFAYRSYAEMSRFLLELNATYSDVVRVSVAQETYTLPYPDELQCMEDENAGTEAPCKQFVVHLTNHSTLAQEPTRPEVFISGALHGNERVGPQAAIELVALLARSSSVYADDTDVLQPSASTRRWARELVNARNVVIMPMTNAYGYAHNYREELHVDPNRDYNYMRSGEECMQAMTSRVVNEIWRDHIFQLAITFHGGTRAVSYEWGSPDHYLAGNSKRSDKSPDHTAQFQLAHTLANFAGVFPDDQLYPTGTMNDVVYGVTGGMEDWGYAASWENQFYLSPGDSPPFLPCDPSTFGGYPRDKTVYNNVTHRAFNMLVETSYKKQPKESDLGLYSELYGADVDFFHTMESDGGGATVGHVPRNVRLALMMIEMVQPLLRWVDADSNEGRTPLDTFPEASKYTMDPESDLVIQMGCGALAWENEEVATCNATDCSLAGLEGKSKLQVAWEVLGALTVDSTFVQVASSPTFVDDNILMETSTQQGTTRRFFEFTPESPDAEDANADTMGTSLFVTCVDLSHATSAEAEQLYIRALATVDQDWADQGDGDDVPSPRVLPQSHVVNARTNPDWGAEWNGHRIKAALEWASPVITVEVAKSEAGSGTREKDSAAPAPSAVVSSTPVIVPSPAASLETSQSGSASVSPDVGSNSTSDVNGKNVETTTARTASKDSEEVDGGSIFSSKSSSSESGSKPAAAVGFHDSDVATSDGSNSALSEFSGDILDTEETAALSSSGSDSGSTSDDDELISKDTAPETTMPAPTSGTPSPTKKVGLTTVGPISSTIHDDEEKDDGNEDNTDSETTLDDEIKASDENTSVLASTGGSISSSVAADGAALTLNDWGLQSNETPSELLNVGYLIMGSGAMIITMTLAYLYRRVFRGGRASYMNINSDDHVARVTINGDDEEYEVDDDEDEVDVARHGPPITPRDSSTSVL